jgi:acyl-CoA thioester hydrolase
VARHLARIRPRWSDVDTLGHVNNVVLLRHMQEARVDMLFVDAAERGTAELARGVVVHRHELDYLNPLPADGGPVIVETWVRKVGAASFELGYEVLAVVDGERTVGAVASSTLVPYDLAAQQPRRLSAAERDVLAGFAADGPRPGERAAAPWPGGAPAHEIACAVRFDDLDSYGHVNNVMLAEYLQEARIDFNRRHLISVRGPGERSVIAYQALDYLRPIPFRTEPVQVEMRVTRVGTSSFDLAYQVRDDDTVFARAATTVVGFDVAKARSRRLGDGERLVLKELYTP